MSSINIAEHNRNIILYNILIGNLSLKNISQILRKSKIKLTQRKLKSILHKYEFDNKYLKILDLIYNTLQSKLDSLYNPPCPLIDMSRIINSYPYYGSVRNKREDFVQNVGDNVLKEDTLDILLNGSNYRHATESQTKSVIINSCVAMTQMLDKYKNIFNNNSIDTIVYSIAIELVAPLSKSSKSYIVSLWLLGLTKKGRDNIMGKTIPDICDYARSYIKNIKESMKHVNRLSALHLNNCDYFKYIAESDITLFIRGSMKSLVGKMFEKIILGTLLSALGLTYVPRDHITENIDHLNNNKIYFWLSAIEHSGREKDATIMYKPTHQYINIDIGLIGKGNPEVISDKITRFNRPPILKEQGEPVKFHTHTLVITAAKNNGKIINETAEETQNKVVVIKNGWAQKIDSVIYNFLGIENHNTITNNELTKHIQDINIAQFLKRKIGAK